MKHLLLLCAIIISVASFGQTAKKTPFQRMLDNYYEDYLRLNPLIATFKGDNRYNDQLPNTASAAYRKAEENLTRNYLDSLKKYPSNKLAKVDQLSHRIFEYELLRAIEGLKYDNYLTPVSQNDFRINFSQLGAGTSTHPFKTVKDYDDFLKRMVGFVAWNDTAIVNMKKGIKAGVVQPKAIIVKVIPQIKAVISDEVTKSMFHKPIDNMPADFSAADKERLTKAYQQAIKEWINPAYSRMLAFIETEYLPATRETSGIGSLPDGKDRYAYLVRSYTTTDITPDAVYELGLKEVARVQKEMEQVKNETGFTGDLQAFFQYLATDPKFFPFKTEQDVVDAYYKIHEKMKLHLLKQFNLVPKTPFEIRPIEKYRAATSAAHYISGTPDGKRPGVFYFPVLDPLKYSYWRMEDLFLHEAIPGHHFQRSIETENFNLPGNQKVGRYGAFTEGWGLYAEKLGKELGLYTDPYQRVGQLQGELHRAIRLVVDAGIHHKGWTREQAIKYSLDNEPIMEQNAIQEVERYMANPGQALSYKMGELKILEIRARAEKKLGKKFDARAFHDQVLKDGSMPLLIFESKMNEWMESYVDTKK